MEETLPTGWYGNPADYFDESGKLKDNVKEAMQNSIKRGQVWGDDDTLDDSEG